MKILENKHVPKSREFKISTAYFRETTVGYIKIAIRRCFLYIIPVLNRFEEFFTSFCQLLDYASSAQIEHSVETSCFYVIFWPLFKIFVPKNIYWRMPVLKLPIFFPCRVDGGKRAAISNQTCFSQKRVRSYNVLALVLDVFESFGWLLRHCESLLTEISKYWAWSLKITLQSKEQDYSQISSF